MFSAFDLANIKISSICTVNFYQYKYLIRYNNLFGKYEREVTDIRLSEQKFRKNNNNKLVNKLSIIVVCEIVCTNIWQLQVQIEDKKDVRYNPTIII